MMIETCEIEMCGEVAIYISPDGLKMCGDCKQKDMNITCNSPGDYKRINGITKKYSLLDDAIKGKTYPLIEGYVLLLWDFDTTKSYEYARKSVQIPEEIADLILFWRDKWRK